MINVVKAANSLLLVMAKGSAPVEFLEHLDNLQDPKAIISKNLYMMEFHAKVQHAFMIDDANGACAKCSKDSKDVMKLVEKGCSLDEASTVAQGSILDSILVWAASGLSKPEQQREPARFSTTKLAISSIIDCVRTWKDKPSFLASDVFN